MRNFGIFNKFLKKFRNSSSGRDFVGGDMYGNEYFQVHDGDGYPIKREVVYKEGIHNSIMDPVWADWLKGSEKLPPKKEEIDDSFKGYLNRKTIGEEFDKRDEEMMVKFREAMKKVAKPKQKDFEPTAWKPENKSGKKY